MHNFLKRNFFVTNPIMQISTFIIIFANIITINAFNSLKIQLGRREKFMNLHRHIGFLFQNINLSKLYSSVLINYL